MTVNSEEKVLQEHLRLGHRHQGGDLKKELGSLRLIWVFWRKWQSLAELFRKQAAKLGWDTYQQGPNAP